MKPLLIKSYYFCIKKILDRNEPSNPKIELIKEVSIQTFRFCYSYFKNHYTKFYEN